MITKENYEILKKEYGLCGSWAIWKQPTSSAKSNTGNMEWANDKDLCAKISTGYVFVGLNWSSSHGDQNNGGEIKWKNFHSDYAFQNDYKLRYALTDTRYWGSYITDIIKYYPETNSSKVATMLKRKPEIAKTNIEHFERELKLLGCSNPVLVAMGDTTYDLLNSLLGSKYKVVKIKHYSYTIGKEDYRKEVLNILNKN